ncbi:MAG: hypothetical protein ABI625_26660 [bacterium]
MPAGIAEDLPKSMETSQSQLLRSGDGQHIVTSMEITKRRVDFMMKYRLRTLSANPR